MNNIRTRFAALGTSALMLASLVGLGGTVTGRTSAEEARTISEQAKPVEKLSRQSRNAASKAIAKAMFGGSWKRSRYPNGPGWTHAHVGRMARKRRNQRRNRKAHRG